MAKSIRFQLLVAVNTAIALVFAIFLVVDYRRDLAERLGEKHVHMEEEAKAILPAILSLSHHGSDSVQEFVDAVCSRMRETDSPGHHIAVDWEGNILQAHTHHRASPQLFEAMRAAAGLPKHRALVAAEEILVGSQQQDGVTVYVSEYVSNLRRSVLGDVLRRLGGIVLLGILAAVIANVVLLRVVVQPLDQLVATVDRIATGQLGAQTGTLNSVELTYLGNAINSMSSSLAEADRARRHEMAKAREIQQHLLPREFGVPGLNVAHLYLPAAEIAGDYYDVIALPDKTWLLCVADVTGHGVPAAMEAAILKAILLHAAEHHSRPDEILSFMNDRFNAVCLPDDFASVILARWDPVQSTVQYASAGHEPGWFLSGSNELRELDSTGPLLGVVAESAWDLETVSVTDGDRLLLVTDGATEAFNPENELFGRERLAALFRECRGVPLSDVTARINDALTAHRGGNSPAADDLTLVVVEFVSRGS